MGAGRRRAWAVAGGLIAAAGVLALLNLPRTPAPPPAPPPPPAPRALDAVRVLGRLETERSLFLLPDGTEIALREESVVSTAQVGEEVRLALDRGEVYVDAPARSAPVVVKTPHASVSTLRGGVHVRASPHGTTVTLAHGAAVVQGAPFSQELTRDETADVAPGGAIREPLRIDTGATLEWAVEARARASLLPNGGFEDDFRHWEGTGYPETQVRIDRRAHLGRKSALVRFNAVRDYDHRTPASDPVPVRPGATYALTGYVEHQDLEVGPDGGIALEVRDARGDAGFRRSTPLWSGNSGWRKFRLDFVPPEGTSAVRVMVTRAMNGAPTQGTLRLDGLALYDLSPR